MINDYVTALGIWLYIVSILYYKGAGIQMKVVDKIRSSVQFFSWSLYFSTSKRLIVELLHAKYLNMWSFDNAMIHVIWIGFPQIWHFRNRKVYFSQTFYTESFRVWTWPWHWHSTLAWTASLVCELSGTYLLLTVISHGKCSHTLENLYITRYFSEGLMMEIQGWQTDLHIHVHCTITNQTPHKIFHTNWEFFTYLML